MKQYIGDVLMWDIYNYTNMKMDYKKINGQMEISESKLVSELRKSSEGRLTFHVPAMLFGSLWFAYHGMYKSAAFFDILIFMTLQMMLRGMEMTGIGCMIILAMVFAFAAIPAYYRHICRNLGERGMLKREILQHDNMAEDLRREGSPSVFGMVLYIALRSLLFVAFNDIINTVIVLNL